MKLICDAYTLLITQSDFPSPCLSADEDSFWLIMYINYMWIHPFFSDEFADLYWNHFDIQVHNNSE